MDERIISMALQTGGERAIVELIKKQTTNILIANELYDMSAGLRTACKPVQFIP